MWNTIHKRIVRSDSGLEESVALVKCPTKNLILECQATETKDCWTDKNFELCHATQLTSQASHSFPHPDFIDIITV